MNGGGISYRTALAYESKLGLKWHEIMALAASGELRTLLEAVEVSPAHPDGHNLRP